MQEQEQQNTRRGWVLDASRWPNNSLRWSLMFTMRETDSKQLKNMSSFCCRGINLEYLILFYLILTFLWFQVADIHMYDTSSMSSQGRMKVDKLEKELNALINSSMSYKSNYKMSAKQMAMQAMQDCESEAASSSKKIRKTVVETSGRRAAVAWSSPLQNPASDMKDETRNYSMEPL